MIASSLIDRALGSRSCVQGSRDFPARECSICSRDFEHGERLTRLPCSSEHTFHRDCIEGWLTRQGTCPLCRSRQPLAYGEAGSPPVRVVPMRPPIATARDQQQRQQQELVAHSQLLQEAFSVLNHSVSDDSDAEGGSVSEDSGDAW